MVQLTPQQIELLRLLAEGLQAKEIAVRLNISPKTVEYHKAQLYSKIGAKGLIDAVKFAIREGYA